MAGLQVTRHSGHVPPAVSKVAIGVRLKENLRHLFTRAVQIIEIGGFEAQVGEELRLGRKAGLRAGNIDLSAKFVALEGGVEDAAKARCL